MHEKFLADTGGIDAVITWVDGADPVHATNRTGFMATAAGWHVNGINPHRWACNDELGYCLRSIANHAPWIRRIWIVTDDQTPDLSHVPAEIRARTKIIDHRAIFAGYEAVLPTFNSLAIESLLWRIPGLAERFVYFNDDVFLTAPLRPEDLFQGEATVLRGRFEDHGAMLSCGAGRDDPVLLNKHVQANAAAMLGFSRDMLFAAAHVVHPMRRSVFAALFDALRDEFLVNISHRFRNVDQFLPQALFNHFTLLQGTAVIAGSDDHLHLRSGAMTDFTVAEVRAYLHRALQPGCKFLCINDLPAVAAAIPETRDVIEIAIGELQVAA